MLDNLLEVLEGAKAHADDEAWGYLLGNVPAMTGVEVAMTLELGERTKGPVDESVAQMLEEGLTEPELIARIRNQLGAAPITSDRRDQLEAGIDYLASGRHHLAVPMLMNSLEGAFWIDAENRGWVQPVKGGWIATNMTTNEGKKLRAIEGLLALDGTGMTDKFRGFLRGLVYGGGGHPYRHGTAEGGWRLRSLCLLVSLVGWLEVNGLMDAREELHGGFFRAEDRRRESSA